MSPPGLGGKPPHVSADEHFGPWFADLADRLLNRCDLVVNSHRHRLAELEAYYCGGPHPDPFAHRDPLQLENGRWYFHRTRGGYRGGSFKGLDLTMGDGTAFFGILIRTIETSRAPTSETANAAEDGRGENGILVVGPSLTVDYLLEQTKAKSVATLDALIAGRSVWDTSSPLHVAEARTPRAATVYRTARVGLSLKTAKGTADAPRFVMRPYRFLTEPKAVTKGKVYLVLALHRAGESVESIHRITGCPKKTVGRYAAGFEAGKLVDGFDPYLGKDLGTAGLCWLHGTWSARHGHNI